MYVSGFRGSKPSYLSSKFSSIKITEFSRSATWFSSSWFLPITYVVDPYAAWFSAASQWMEMNRSPFSRLAMAVRSYSSRKRSSDRVSTTSTPGNRCWMSSATFLATNRATSFSFLAYRPVPRFPGSFPPCPASMITLSTWLSGVPAGPNPETGTKKASTNPARVRTEPLIFGTFDGSCGFLQK